MANHQATGKGVQEPQCVRKKVVIPSLAYVKKALTVADDDLALHIVTVAGAACVMVRTGR
ncbi:hypothetical protein ACFY2Z_23695 [Streptomyces sp. NPDC001222]|uniref:hypothetical protein n=1 Tax=Streptomyces sp. NPDC001222 TaxID=3364548 RepID=UPI0036D1EA07